MRQPLCDFHLSLNSLLKTFFTIQLETASPLTPFRKQPHQSNSHGQSWLPASKPGGCHVPSPSLLFFSALSPLCCGCTTPQKPSTLTASANQYL